MTEVKETAGVGTQHVARPTRIQSKPKTTTETPPETGEIPAVAALKPKQKEQLARCEKKIAEAQGAFFTIVDAVAEIAAIIGDRVLAAYCRLHLDMGGSTVSHYKKANVVLESLKDAGVTKKDLPKNEGQTRSLSKLLVKDRDGEWVAKKVVEVWKKILDSGIKPTAAEIEKHLPKKKGATKTKVRWITKGMQVAVDCSADDAAELAGLLGAKVKEEDGLEILTADALPDDFEVTASRVLSWLSDHKDVNQFHFSVVR